MKRILIMLSIVAVILTGCGKEILPAYEPDYYLYEVSDDEGHNLYLLGTIHIGAQPVVIDGLLKEAYDNASIITFEILFDITEKKTEMMNRALARKPLSEIENEKIEEIWKAFIETYPEINQAAFNYNAMYASSLANEIIWKELNLDAQNGVDYTLYQLAKQDGKQLEEIEGWAFQTELMCEMGEKAPFLILISYLDKEAQIEDTKAMVQAYSEGSIYEEVFKTIDESSFDEETLPEKYRTGTLEEEWRAYNEILISSRNESMFEKAKEYLVQDQVLLAVGAGHLLGETGLVQQFKNAGYTVRKMEN